MSAVEGEPAAPSRCRDNLTHVRHGGFEISAAQIDYRRFRFGGRNFLFDVLSWKRHDPARSPTGGVLIHRQTTFMEQSRTCAELCHRKCQEKSNSLAKKFQICRRV